MFDGLDNDDDGLIDYPFDPDAVQGGLDEADPAAAARCSNGEDDDEDGVVDFPDDVRCSSAGDDSEDIGRQRPQCTNRIDDDQDGVTDCPMIRGAQHQATWAKWMTKMNLHVLMGPITIEMASPTIHLIRDVSLPATIPRWTPWWHRSALTRWMMMKTG